MSPGAVLAVTAWGAFTLWVFGSVARDCVRYRRMLRERREVTAFSPTRADEEAEA